MTLTRRHVMIGAAATAAVAALPAEDDVVFEFNVENTKHVLNTPWIGGRSGAFVTRNDVAVGQLIRLPLSIRVVEDGGPSA